MTRLRLLILSLLMLPSLAMAQSGDPSFNIVNRSGQVINEIYVSPTPEPNWGRDLLGTETLANGRSFPVRLNPSVGCMQDIRVVYADGRPEERRNQNTCGIVEMVFGSGAGGGQAEQQGGNPSFNLVNHGSGPIREIYVSSARENTWGRDRLGRDVLAIGRWLEVQLPVGDCVNDVRIVWMDGRAEERRNVDTCRLINVVFP